MPVENDESSVDDEVSAAFDPEAGHDTRVCITVVNKVVFFLNCCDQNGKHFLVKMLWLT